MPFELWEVKRFSNDTISFNNIKPSKTSESINTIATTSEQINTVNKEVVVYTEEEHLNKSSEYIVDLYNTIKEFILGLDDTITIKPKKLEIGFAYKNKMIVDIHLQKRALKMWLNTTFGSLEDSKGICRDVTNIGHWGNGDYEIQISNDDDIEYIFSLIKQLYRIKRI
ncbi:MAG: DUF5655 domain-containing protein [Paraclostridium sp.]